MLNLFQHLVWETLKQVQGDSAGVQYSMGRPACLPKKQGEHTGSPLQKKYTVRKKHKVITQKAILQVINKQPLIPQIGINIDSNAYCFYQIV